MDDFAVWFRTSKAAESMPQPAVDAWLKLVIPHIHSMYLLSLRFNAAGYKKLLSRLTEEDDATMPGMYLRMQLTGAMRINKMREKSDPWGGL